MSDICHHILHIDPALGATEVDLMKAIMKNKGDDVNFNPDSFNGQSSYDFMGSDSVYAAVSITTSSSLLTQIRV